MALTVAFRGVPGDDAPVARPLIDLRLAELPELPVTCLLDTGSIGNRLGRWVAEAAGLDLSAGAHRRLSLGGSTIEAVDIDVRLRLGEHAVTHGRRRSRSAIRGPRPSASSGRRASCATSSPSCARRSAWCA